MIWSLLYVLILFGITCYPLNVTLPFRLLLSFVVQQSHYTANVFHAELFGETFCNNGHASLIFIIRLNLIIIFTDMSDNHLKNSIVC